MINPLKKKKQKITITLKLIMFQSSVCFQGKMGNFIQGPFTYQHPPVYTRTNGLLSLTPSGIPFLINPNTYLQGCKMVTAGGICDMK